MATGLVTGGERQTGQVGWSRSQRSTQRWWKACAHWGSTRSTSPAAYSPRHTAQHAAAGAFLVAATAPSSFSSPYTTLGSVRSAASSSPASTSSTPPTKTAAAAVRACDDDEDLRRAGGAARREHARSRAATVTTASTLTTAKAASSSTIPRRRRRRTARLAVE